MVLFVVCLTSQQYASVSHSQGWIFSENCTCCHIEIEAADYSFASHPVSILTPDQSVPVLNLLHQVPGRVATEVPVFKAVV